MRPDATLSEFSRLNLQELLGNGLLFTVASARSVVAIQMMLKGISLSLPVIEFNGAFLSDLATGRHEVVNAIDPFVAEDFFGLAPDYGCVPFVSTFSGNNDLVYYNEIINDGMRWYVEDRIRARDRRLRRIENLADSLHDQVVCFTVIGEPSILADMRGAIGERYGDRVATHFYENRYSPGWYWLTMHDQRATKDQAIRVLMDAYDLGGSTLVVFGDDVNDIDMFEMADRSIAVANAIPELRSRATEVIGPSTEDSVVSYLLKQSGQPS